MKNISYQFLFKYTEKEYLDDLSYEWVLVSQPKNSKAQMEKKENKIESSQLIAGLYQFEVSVFGLFQYSNINYTCCIFKIQ